MSYIVRQKIKGRIYLYEATSYWDKDKKQNRQKRKYLGPEDAQNSIDVGQYSDKDAIGIIKNKNKIRNNKNLRSFNYGNIKLLENISKKLGIVDMLKSHFPDHYQNILLLAYYSICKSSPFYLFPYWQEEHDIFDQSRRKLHSSSISNLCNEIGVREIDINNFENSWTNHINPIDGIYYDITSISIYSTNIDFVEWGYNRDKENLPQINLCMTCCANSKLPLFYKIFPGSIVDVSTLKNFITYVKSMNLENIRLIMDKGFCSKENIIRMSNNDISFIQPISFVFKDCKNLVKKYKRKLLSNSTIFKHNEEILHHVQDKIKFDDKEFNSHIFFNETAYNDYKNRFFATILDIENNVIKDRAFSSFKEYKDFKKENLNKKYHSYFKLNKEKMLIEKNDRKISSHLSKIGYFIIAENIYSLSKEQILSYYKNRDKIEKIFDVSKNDMDQKRLGVHDKYTNNGKFFIKYIALIIHTKISNIMKEHDLFKKYSVRQLLEELKKLKINIYNKDSYISEISKKQKDIFSKFDIDWTNLTKIDI